MLAKDLIERTEARRQAVSHQLDDGHRSALGQFFTPHVLADFIASLIELPEAGRFTVLDPGAGVGSLTAAVVARVLRERPELELRIVAFELDPALLPHLRATLADCARTAADEGRRVTMDLRDTDFVGWAAASLGELCAEEPERFSACVMNPPYRKISTTSPGRLALQRVGVRVSNLYPAFLALAAGLLKPGGGLSAITPRSFANGPYFEEFRRYFLDRMAFTRLHVFDRRDDVFADAKVLQENVVFHAVRAAARSTVTLSASAGYHGTPRVREVPSARVVRPEDRHRFIRIPIDENATHVAERIANLPVSLREVGVRVSTGRVVDFRAREHLVHDPLPEFTVPLIYPSHLHGGRVEWPRLDGKKPNALASCDETRPLLLPRGTYVLVKRFTAKEERRRVVAAVFQPEDAPAEAVAFENHLNVYHRDGTGLPMELAFGLTAFLNSTTVDAYVRQFSGHTQINATDLRLLRYPTEAQLTRLGKMLLRMTSKGTQAETDRYVATCVPAFCDEPVDASASDEPVLAGAVG